MEMESSSNQKVDATTLEAAGDVFSKKWSLAVVRELLTGGPQGFSDLEEALEDVSGKVLSECLDSLQEDDVVERRVLQEEPLRVEYTLTDRGHDLEPAVSSLETWAETHLVARSPTVLLVDDDDRLLEMHTNWLEDTYEVRSVTDGKSARDHLDDTVDVLVTDQRMPGLSGAKLAQYVDVSDFDCRVLLLSSVDIDESLREMPFDECLRKPTTPEELKDAVETAVDGSNEPPKITGNRRVALGQDD